MSEGLKALLKKSSENEELAKKILKGDAEADDAYQARLIEIAKSEGITLAASDFEQNEEISKEEMANVVGAGAGCACAWAGVGLSGDPQHCQLECTCNMHGTGGIYPDKVPTSKGGCICAVAGAGAVK